MKGKYAARAERTRDLNTLEERARAAERDRDRLAAQVGTLTRQREREAAALTADLAAAREQRDKRASPDLMKAKARVYELEAEVVKLKASDKHRQETHNKVFKALHEMLRGMGLTGLEAEECLLNMVIGGEGTVRIADVSVGVDGHASGRMADNGQLVALQRSRGHRNLSDATAVIMDAVRAAAEDFRTA